eukprot:CAMPEP_0171103046 /NCGR_PEP_ID=MMETSP0766_2-20121228/58706_1 /TAXON_ID=439317 /ORGANISM="Gambierdiscus australes, Strain CAWD 149" /LENGTH=93 /DNA_ID=CAMNT_0011563441 /DNA_START=91 /DNA_END=372 /DNA_ORIENTATION=+
MNPAIQTTPISSAAPLSTLLARKHPQRQAAWIPDKVNAQDASAPPSNAVVEDTSDTLEVVEAQPELDLPGAPDPLSPTLLRPKPWPPQLPPAA